MSISSANFTRQYPSTQAPGIMSTQTQILPINAFVGEAGVETYASEGDLATYKLTLSPSTPVAISQNRQQGTVPEVSYSISQIQAPIYRVKARAVSNIHDSNAVGRFDIPHDEVLNALLLQSIAQAELKNMIFGANPNNTEGFINNAPLTALPPLLNDAGVTATSWSNYDPIQLFTFILTAIRTINTNTLNRGKIEAVITSTRVYNLLQLTFPTTSQYASFFGSSVTVWAAVEFILRQQGKEAPKLFATDLLAGDSAGLTAPDYMLFSTPSQELDNSPYNLQNAFGNVRNDHRLVTMVQAGNPKFLTAPISAENREIVAFADMSSGWVLNPSAQFIYSAKYSQ